MRFAETSLALLLIGCSVGGTTASVDVEPAVRSESWGQFADERDEDAVALQEAVDVLRAAEPEAAELAVLEARTAAARSTTRNALPAAWLLAGGDGTLEYYDDPLGLAVTQAVHAAVSVFPGRDEGALPMPVVVRARRLGGADPVGFQESVVAALGPFAWLTPTELAGGADGVAGAAQRAELGEHVLLLEVEEVDRFFREEGDWDLPVTRVDATAALVDVGSGRVLGRHTASAFAQDLRHRWGVPGMWALWMAIGAVATTGLAWRRERGRDALGSLPSLRIASLVGVAAYVAGLVLAAVASQVSGGFLPDWGQTAVLFEVGGLRVPHPAALAWPAVHGGVVMLGPVLLLAWASLKVQSLPAVSLPDDLNVERLLAVVAPAAQAGALTVLFAAAVASEPGLMGDTAAPMAAVGLLASLALARPVADLVGGSSQAVRNAGAAAMAGVALLALLPLGLFGGWAWPVSALLAVPVIGALVLTRERAPEGMASVDEPDGLESAAGGADPEDQLVCPGWVAVLEPQELAARLEKDDLLLLRGPSQSGLTRCVDELLRGGGLGRRVELDASRTGGDAQTTPFASVASLLARLGAKADALRARTQGAAAQRAVQAGVEQTLSVIPAVGAVLGLLESDVDVAGVQRTRVIEQGARLLLAKLRQGQIGVVVLASAERLDPSSDEVLARAIELSRERPGGLASRLRWLVTRDDGQDGAPRITALTGAKHSVSLPSFETRHAEELVGAAGVKELPKELIEHLNQTSGGLPGVLLGHLRQFVEGGLLEARPGGGLRPADAFDERSLDDHFRRSSQRFLARIAELPEGDREVLEVAALCGRTFTASEVAVATQRPLVEVARRLHGLATSEGALLDDLRDVPGWFAFRSSYTFGVLRGALDGTGEREARAGDERPKQKPQPSELARAVHLRVALPPPGSPPIPAERRLHHALLAPAEARGAAVEVGRVIVDRLAERVAWPELASLLERLAPFRGHGRWEDEVGIDLVEARLARFRNDAALKEAARERLERHVERGIGEGREVAVLFPAVVAWGDLLHGNRALHPRLAERCSALERDALPLVREALLFYRLIVGPAAAPTALRELLAAVDALPASRHRALLQARMLNKLAEWCWFEIPKDASEEARLAHFQSVAEPLIERGLRLRHQLGDVRGEAMDCSAKGRALLWNLKRPADALPCFERNLDLVESRGIDSDLSVALNFVATAQKDLAGTVGSEEAGRLRAEAFEMARRAEEAAVRFGQTRARAYAAKVIVQPLGTVNTPACSPTPATVSA